jgi:hypothetical protein
MTIEIRRNTTKSFRKHQGDAATCGKRVRLQQSGKSNGKQVKQEPLGPDLPEKEQTGGMAANVIEHQ